MKNSTIKKTKHIESEFNTTTNDREYSTEQFQFLPIFFIILLVRKKSCRKSCRETESKIYKKNILKQH